MLARIKKTLIRLSGKIYGFNPVDYFPLLMEGIGVEFERFRVFKNQVLSCTVPNDNMDSCCIEDYNTKYGIPATLPGTTAQKIQRIISKAELNGYPGRDWLTEQVQAAGFPLFALENEVLTSSIRQYEPDGVGSLQYAPDPQRQYGLTQRFTDPSGGAGYLIVSSPPFGAGRAYLSKYFPDPIFQYQADGTTRQYGTADKDQLNPQPFRYTRTIDPRYWGFYFALTPAGGPYVNEADFLPVTQREFDYLVKLILEIKLLRNWCILQVRITD